MPVEYVHVEAQEPVGPTIGKTDEVLKTNLASESLKRTATQEITSSTTAKTIEEIEILKSQPEVIVQDLSPPVIIVIARALASEGVGREYIEAQNQVELPTGETDEASRPNLASELASQFASQQPASPTIARAAEEVKIPSSQQDPIFKEASSSAATTSAGKIPISEGVQGRETTRTSEIDVSAQATVGSPSPSNETSLFPEIFPGDASAQTSEQPKVVVDKSILEESSNNKPSQEQTHTPEVIIEQSILDQPQSGDVPTEQVQLEQAHPAEVLHFNFIKLVIEIS